MPQASRGLKTSNISSFTFPSRQSSVKVDTKINQLAELFLISTSFLSSALFGGRLINRLLYRGGLSLIRVSGLGTPLIQNDVETLNFLSLQCLASISTVPCTSLYSFKSWYLLWNGTRDAAGVSTSTPKLINWRIFASALVDFFLAWPSSQHLAVERQ